MGIELREIKPATFIYEALDALPASLCRDMVQRFEAAVDEQYEGHVGQTVSRDPTVKRSTDLVVSGKAHWKDVDTALFRSLAQAMRELARRHPFFTGAFKDMGYAIQRTLPGEFYHWHIDGGSHSFSHRQLVAIWYLNDVPGPGGGTEFRHQQITVAPRTGKLILFPPFWTHEHRGVTLEHGVKYLATTWIVFA
ncbi:MAG: 2OG-Fe(II) oxygenase [Gammaproteobacteria bacterium]|nr:2OG-Fe(II) oxygenase [Gammaproteobacteria bacterium]